MNEETETIRLVDIFAKQIEMTTALAVITEQLKQIPDHENRLRAIEKDMEHVAQIDDHEHRLRGVEKWRYGLPLTALLSVGSLAIGAYGWLHH